MYCPACFQDTLKLRSNGVVKLSFNGKSRSTSLFTFNLVKDNKTDLHQKLRNKIIEYFEWYAPFKHRDVLKNFEITSSDCQCSNGCKIDLSSTKVSVIDVLYSFKEIEKIFEEEGPKFKIEFNLNPP